MDGVRSGVGNGGGPWGRLLASMLFICPALTKRIWTVMSLGYTPPETPLCVPPQGGVPHRAANCVQQREDRPKNVPTVERHVFGNGGEHDEFGQRLTLARDC